MYEVKIIDKHKPILYLKWEGKVKKHEVEEVNEKLKELIKEINNKNFYFLVDVKELNVFMPETKEAIIEQQKLFVPQIIKIASVMKNVLTKVQLKETREKAKNDKEVQFGTYEEALQFLKKQ